QLALEMSHDQRINAAPAVRPEAADHELLLVLELQFSPVIRSLAGLIQRAPPLCDHALETQSTDGRKPWDGDPGRSSETRITGFVPTSVGRSARRFSIGSLITSRPSTCK